MFYHAFTIEHSVEKPVEELGDAAMSPLFHRVSAVCPVLHVFGVVHIPVEQPIASTLLMMTANEPSARPPRPSPAPRPPITILATTPPASQPRPSTPVGDGLAGPSPLTGASGSVRDAVLVQRHGCLHVHGVYPYFYVPQYHDDVSATQFGAQLEAVALRELFSAAPSGRGEAPPPRTSVVDPLLATQPPPGRASTMASAPAHRQLLHNVERVRRVPFYGYHSRRHAFFKISVIDPSHVAPLVELLRDTTLVGQRAWQPYESHNQFHSQFMMDYGISGMAPVRLHRCTLRCPVPVELAALVPPTLEKAADLCAGARSQSVAEEAKEAAIGTATKRAVEDTEAAESARCARRRALDVVAVALPDERARLTAAEVELDVRGVDLHPPPPAEEDGDACAVGGATAERAAHRPARRHAPVGAHLAHTRRSLKQYFLHHGVPDRLRVADTMAAEAHAQEAMRRGFTTATALRYGTAAQLQRNDPAACAMRARLRELLTVPDGARAQAQAAKRETKPEKPPFWLLKQQQQDEAAQQGKQPWLPQAASFMGNERLRAASSPWAELNPLGPPCQDDDDDGRVAIGAVTRAPPHLPPTFSTSEAALVARPVSDDAVPQTYELLEALRQPLPAGPLESPLSAPSVGEAPVLEDAEESCLLPSRSRSDSREPSAENTSGPRRDLAVPENDPLPFQPGDTVAFVLRITRPLISSSSPSTPQPSGRPSARSAEATTAPSKITLRVLVAGRLCTLSTRTQSATVQWLVSLPETHFHSETKQLVRDRLWLSPENLLRTVTPAHTGAQSVMVGAGEWLLTEDTVPQDRLPLHVLQHATPLHSLEAALASEDGDGARVALVACPLRIFASHASYQRAVQSLPVLMSGSMAPLAVAIVCRYSYSFRSRLLRPLDPVQVTALHATTSFAMAPPRSARDEQDEETEADAAAIGEHVPLAHTQRGSFLLFPEQDTIAPLQDRAKVPATRAAGSHLSESSPSALLSSSSSSSSWPSLSDLFSAAPTEAAASMCTDAENAEEEAEPLLVTPPSSSSSCSSAHSTRATQNTAEADTLHYACQPVRTAEELTRLLDQLPFRRSVTAVRQRGDTTLTQGRLVPHLASSGALPMPTRRSRRMPATALTPPAPWQSVKRSRETRDAEASHEDGEAGPWRAGPRPPRGSVRFLSTPPDAITEAVLRSSRVHSDDKVTATSDNAHPSAAPLLSPPPPLTVASIGSDALARPLTVSTLDAGEEEEAATDVQEVVVVAATPACQDHAEVVLSHSTSPLSVEEMVTTAHTGLVPAAVSPPGSAAHGGVDWHALTTTSSSAPSMTVLRGAVPCVPRAFLGDDGASSHVFLLARAASTAHRGVRRVELPQRVTASAWPCAASDSSSSSSLRTLDGGKAAMAAPPRPPPPPPPAQPQLPSSTSLVATHRRSETTLSSPHFLSCALRVQHIEVLLRRREGAQQVVGDPLLAVALGQASTDRESIAVCLFCVSLPSSAKGTAASSAASAPPVTDDEQTERPATGAAPSAPPLFSSSPLPSRPAFETLQGHTWCLTDRVTVVELPTERALLLRVQHEIAGYDPDILVSWEGFKYGLGLLSLRYRAVLGRSLARDLSRLRPAFRVVDELTHLHTGHVKDTGGGVLVGRVEEGTTAVSDEAPAVASVPRRYPAARAPFSVILPASATRGAHRDDDEAKTKMARTSPTTNRTDAAPERTEAEAEVDDDDDEIAAAVAAYNLDLDEDATDVQTAIAKRYAKRFGATVRIAGRVVSSISKDIRKTVKLASHTLPHAHQVLTGQHLPYFSDATLSHLYTFDGSAAAQDADPDHTFGSVRGGHRQVALRYLLTNVVAVHRVTSALHYHTQAMEFSRLYGVLYEESMSRGTQFKCEATLFRMARPQGYLMLSPSTSATHRQPRIQRIPLILQPRSDLYRDPVIVLDFRSLYPSVVVAYNLCYSTCLGLVQPGARGRLGVLPGYEPDQALLRDLLHVTPDVKPQESKREPDDEDGDDDDQTHTHLERTTTLPLSPSSSVSSAPDEPLGVHIAPNGAIFVPPFVREGVLPQMLSAVLDTRFEIQAADKHVAQPLHDDAMHTRLQEQQLALKMLANTTYGYTAASFTGRMPCVDLAEAIVAFGRQTLERAIALVHERTEWRAEVVYGDTDSLFVHLPGRTREEAFAMGEAIASAVTASNPAPITLQFEKVLQPCVLLVKKRYAGYAWFKPQQTTPTFLAKGIETVRRDQCPMTARIMETLLRALFDGASTEQLHDTYRAEAMHLRSGHANVSEFIFRRAVKLGRYQDERHLPLAARLALKQMQRDLLQTPLWGERLPYVVCRSLLSTKLKDQVVSPQELIACSNRLTIDTEYYMRSHLNAVLDRVFYLVGISFSRWYADLARRGQWASYMDVAAFLHLQAQRQHDEATGKERVSASSSSSSSSTRSFRGTHAEHKGRRRLRNGGSSASQVSASCEATTVSGEEVETDDEDGTARDRPVDVELAVGPTPHTLSPITVDELSPLAGPTRDLSVVDIDAAELSTQEDEAHKGPRTHTATCSTTGPIPTSRTRPHGLPSNLLMATQHVDGMRTLDRYYPRARCVVCAAHSVTLEAHQQQLRAALHRARREKMPRGTDDEMASRTASLRAVPPICMTCWSDPLTLLCRVQTRQAAIAQRLHTLEEACQVCLGSLGRLGGPTYLRTLADVEDLPVCVRDSGVGRARPASSVVPRHLTQPVAFLTVTEALHTAATRRAHQERVTRVHDDDAQADVVASTLGCTSIDCTLSFDKRELFLQRTQLQALLWYLKDVL